MPKTTQQILEELFVDSIGEHKFIDPKAAAEAGVPRKFIETVRHRSVHVTTAEQARAAAEEIAPYVDEAVAGQHLTDPAELARQLPATEKETTTMELTETLLNDIVRTWREAGLDPGPVETVAGHAASRLENLRRQQDALSTEREEARRRIISQLASGDLTITEAERAFVEEADTGPDYRRRVFELVNATVDAVVADAGRKLQQVGDGFILDFLAPAHAEVVATVLANAEAIADVEDDATAFRLGGRARTAWGLVSDAAERRQLLIAAYSALAQGGILTPLPRHLHHEAPFYRYPDAPLPHDFRRLHRCRALVALCQSGLQPAILTAAQASDNAARAYDASHDIDYGNDAA